MPSSAATDSGLGKAAEEGPLVGAIGAPAVDDGAAGPRPASRTQPTVAASARGTASTASRGIRVGATGRWYEKGGDARRRRSRAAPRLPTSTEHASHGLEALVSRRGRERRGPR